ncbi:MAG: hypothetical protein IKH22_10595 [Prevotella sp.]|jgi:hypothetical protein|nr:hypothetical protein [Prevotella sp.]
MAEKHPTMKPVMQRYTCKVRPLTLAEKRQLRLRIERAIKDETLPA